MTMTTPALIALGSNLGDRRRILERALTALASTPGVQVDAVSSFHETAPVGGPAGQDAFLNAAATLSTTLDPEPLLNLLNAVEAQADRVRSVRWGARTLDLDLLLFGSTLLQTPRLILPHPRMALRRFVLAPAAEIAPDLVHPPTGLSIAALLANIDRRPSHVALTGAAIPSVLPLLTAALDTAFPVEPWLVTPLPPSQALRTFSPEAHPGHKPTFVVILKPAPDDESLAGFHDVPRLVVDPCDPAAVVAEIVAACAATRP